MAGNLPLIYGLAVFLNFRRMRWNYLIIFLLFGFQAANAQTDPKERLALEFYKSGDYEKAAELYEKLANDQPQSVFFYDQYILCLLELKQGDKALKFVQKRKKKDASESRYLVDEYWILKETQQEKKAEQVWDDMRAKMAPNPTVIIQTANLFIKRSLNKEAIAWYERGEIVMGDQGYFSSEVSALLMRNGERQKAIERYIKLLEFGRISIDQLQQLLDASLTDSLDFILLRNLLVKEIQVNPDQWDINSLLRWTYIKQKDWNAAFIQTRSLDKRLKQKGEHMVVLGELCLDNEAWDVARQCFEYVISQGEGGFYTLQARSGLLSASYQWCISGTALSLEQKNTIEKDFLAFLNTYGIEEGTYRALMNLSELYIYYWDETLKGVELLERALESSSLSLRKKSELKLRLGDGYIIQGDEWMSEYMYGQVEKDYEEDALGQEAKFRRARLSYFRGDFEWSKTQLDVLKDATTQLISNNAMRLALTITDNLGLDSNYDALERFAKSELYFMQHKYKESEALLDSIQRLYPGHSLKDEIFFQRALIREKEGKYEEAIVLYETLYGAFKEDILADNALFRIGMIYMQKLQKNEEAKKAFQTLIFDHPGSFYVSEARKYFRKLRGDDV